MPAAQLDPDERAEQAEPRGVGAERPGGAPADVVAAHGRPHDGEQAAHGEQQPCVVDRLAPPPRLSASSRGASSATTTPTGTLTQKIQCHDSALVSSPPAIGPSATPSPEIAAQVPGAAGRPSGGKAVESSVSVSGITTADPMPWATRAPTRTAGEPASPATADAAVKTTTPPLKTRRRPKRSPSAAPVSMSTAKARM